MGHEDVAVAVSLERDVLAVAEPLPDHSIVPKLTVNVVVGEAADIDTVDCVIDVVTDRVVSCVRSILEDTDFVAAPLDKEAECDLVINFEFVTSG